VLWRDVMCIHLLRTPVFVSMRTCLFNRQLLVGWWSFDVKGFWALWDSIYERLYCYNRCRGKAVEGFCALRDVYDYVFSTLDFPVILDGRFTSVFIFLIPKIKGSVCPGSCSVSCSGGPGFDYWPGDWVCWLKYVMAFLNLCRQIIL
jgi:hypothetical protein